MIGPFADNEAVSAATLNSLNFEPPPPSQLNLQLCLHQDETKLGKHKLNKKNKMLLWKIHQSSRKRQTKPWTM